MATHSSILAWRTPWVEEPGGLQSMELQRAGHNTQTYSVGCYIGGYMLLHICTEPMEGTTSSMKPNINSEFQLKRCIDIGSTMVTSAVVTLKQNAN